MTDMVDKDGARARDRAPGAALAAARTAQNLSVTDVARQLKLSVSQVTALEAGEFDRLPGPVFVRGFVRNYARLLKLDPERIVDAIMPNLSEQEVSKELPASRDIPFPSERTRMRRWPGLALAALVAVVALAAYEFYWNEPEETTITKSAPTVAPAPAAEQSASTALPVTASGVQASQSESARAAQAPDAASGAAEPPLAARQVGDGELHFTFAKDSWVQVRERSSGKTIFTRLNPAGSEQRVSGKPPLMLVIGNARSVQVTYNARPVDLGPYIVRDDVARFTLE